MRTLTTEENKKLRSIKTVSIKVKAIMLEGCKEQGAYIQFHRDVQLYNLKEALMYAENYFPEETIQKVLKAVL